MATKIAGKYTQNTVLTTDKANQTGNYQVAGALTGTTFLDLNGTFIAGAPTNPNDYTQAGMLVSKAYVDDKVQGLSWKEPVLAASVAILDNNVDISGSPSYSEPTITATLASAGVFNLDGVALADGNRILIKNEGDVGGLGGAANGIYTVGISGTALTLTRSADMNAGSEFPSATVFIKGGTTQADQGWTCTNNTDPTLGTTSVSFVQFNGTGSVPDATDGVSPLYGVKGKITADSDYGLSITDGVLRIDLDTTSGLEFDGTSKNLQVKTEASNATLQIDGSNQLGVRFSGTVSGLEAISSGLAINLEGTTPTLQVNGSNELGVKFDTAAGLDTSATGLQVQLSSTGGLEFNAGDIQINLDTNPGLSLSGTGLKTLNGDGIDVDTNGLRIDLASNSGLELTAANGSGQLRVDLDTNPGLQLGAGGISVKAGDGLTTDTNGVLIDLASNSGLELSNNNGSGQLRINLDTNPGLQLGAGGISILLDTAPGLVLGAGGIKVNYDNDSIEVNGATELQVGHRIETRFGEVLTLDGTDISNGYKQLTNVVTPATYAATHFIIKTSNGVSPKQEYSVDFTIMTNGGGTISYLVWKTSGTGLTGTHPTVGLVADLVTGDAVSADYQTSLYTPAA